ncbi:MAG: thioredoxin-disulfide reductase [Clostridiales bacterium]|nr:thioredoxin-disulfide reductase [Clostridiales bacterium]
MKDVIIVGSGPAGLTAAIYAKRAGLDMLVIEKNYASGGQVLTTYEVDNYPALPGINGFDLGMQMREHADKLGAEFLEAEVISVKSEGAVKQVVTDNGTYEAASVILAMGASHARLGAPGEEEMTGMGVSYCATCDGAFFKNKDVAVIGGGDVAVEDAIFLARTSRKVWLVHRRDELRAAKSLQQKLFELENVEVVWDSVVEQIEGSDQVEGIRVQNVKDGTKQEIAVQGIFVAVGILPNSGSICEEALKDEKGYFEAGEDCATSVPGIFAAGDIRTKALRQIVTAVADGANAVTGVQNYLLTR